MDQQRDEAADFGAQCVVRTLQMIETLSREGPSRLADLARNVDLPKSTTHRLLKQLQGLGYVTQDPTLRTYRLTLKLFEVGYRIVASTGLREKALPLMEKLMQETGETVLLSALDSGEIVYVEKIESRAIVRLASPIGSRVPLHATAAGKAILSGYWPARWSAVLAAGGYRRGFLPRVTERTIVDIRALEEELAAIAERGYAIDDEESTPRVRAVAAPVRDVRGETIAAVSVAGVDFRLPIERLPELGRAVMAVARELEDATAGRRVEA